MTQISRLLLTLLAASPAGDVASDDVPCGAAIIADCSSGTVVVWHAAALAKAQPWVPVCCWIPSPVDDVELVAAFQALPPRALLVRGGHGALDRNAACLAAFRRAASPTTEAFVEYVALRTGHPEFGAHVLAAIEPERNVHRSTHSRRLSPISPFVARDWRSLYSLCRAFSGPLVTTDEAAGRAGKDARTLRAWCEQYLDGSYGELKERFGWRWIPEVALRRVGLIRTRTAEGRADATA